MKFRIAMKMLLIAGLVFTALSSAALAENAAKSEYKIPDHLSPVWKWKNGYSAQETTYFRRAYTGEDAQLANDIGAYSARNFSEVLTTAVIHRDGPVVMLEKNPMPEIADVVAKTDLGTMPLGDMMKDPRARMKAIAVVHKGKLVFEEYIGIRPWDNHLWASASKTITGLMVYQLADEGTLDMTAPVSSYLPELEGTVWSTVPVVEVFHHRTGLDIGEGNVGKPKHPISLFYAIMTGADAAPEDASLIDAVKLAKKLEAPGKTFEYSSMNTFVLGAILERITGKPVNDLITERIWSKAGMEGDALLALSPKGEPSIHGLFFSRLRDMARFGTLFTPSWDKVTTERLVPKEYLSKVYAEAKPDLFAGNNIGDRMIATFGNIGMGASYHWDVVFPDGDIYKSGRTGQCLYISPDTDTVVVWFSSAYDNTLWVHAYAREIVKQMFRK